MLGESLLASRPTPQPGGPGLGVYGPRRQELHAPAASSAEYRWIKDGWAPYFVCMLWRRGNVSCAPAGNSATIASSCRRRLFTVPTGRDGKEPRKTAVIIAAVSAEILTTRLSSSVEYQSSCWVAIARLQSSGVPTGRVSWCGLFNGRTLILSSPRQSKLWWAKCHWDRFVYLYECCSILLSTSCHQCFICIHLSPITL